jgi:hypothetical protein
MGFANRTETRLLSQGIASSGGFKRSSVSAVDSQTPPPPDELTIIRCKWSCRVASVHFVGIQPGFGIRPDLLLFCPLYGLLKHSTLAVDLRSASPLTIAYRLSRAIVEARR